MSFVKIYNLEVYIIDKLLNYYGNKNFSIVLHWQ